MQRGRGRGSGASKQSVKENEMKIRTIKEEPGAGVKKLSNSGQSDQNLSVSISNAHRTLLPTPIKEVTVTESQDTDQYEDLGTASGSSKCIQQDLDVGKNNDNTSAVVPVQPCSSSAILKLAEKVDTVDETTKPTFVCRTCDISCTSEVSFQQHLAGRKHKCQMMVKRNKIASMAAIKNKTPNKPVGYSRSSKVDLSVLQKATPPPGSSMQSVMRMLCETEDVVGMQYITEYRKLGTARYRYMCELCDVICNMDEMVEHLVTRKHRMRYARLHLFRAYTQMTDYPSFTNMMLPKQLDKFLARLCARVVNADAARGLRPLRAKQYINESDICIDIGVFSSIGKQPPTMIEDLIIAENILEEADSIRQGPRMQPPSLIGPSLVRRGNLGIKLSEFDPADAIIKKSPLISKPKLKQRSTAIIFLEKKKKSILQSLEANSRSVELYGLTVMSSKERDVLLKHLNATNVKLRELRGIDQQTSHFDSGYLPEDDPNPTGNSLPNRRREHSDYEEIPPKRIKDDTSQSESLSDPLAEIQKAVEPIIAETRRRVEQKIYEAMESGNLSSVLNALQNNPNLHETLQKWEEGQKTQEDAGSSLRPLTHIENDEYPGSLGPPQRRPELTKDRGQSGHPEHPNSAPPQKHPRLLEDHGYSEYSDAGRPPRLPRHTETQGYAIYSDSRPLQRRQGQIGIRGNPDYSEASLLQRQPVRNEVSRYPGYSVEANVSEDFFNERKPSMRNIDRAVELRPPVGLQRVRRRGLLGARPSLSMDTMSSHHHSYNDAGW